MKCKYEQIYILCPKKYASGGPDALHQLCYYIKKIGFKNVYMVYVDLMNNENGLNKKYKIYETKSINISQIIDSKNTLIVLPENLYRYSCLWKKANISIWWLSVDNFRKKSIKYDIKNLLIRLLKLDFQNAFIYLKLIFFINKKIYNNFSASYYANDFLNKKNIKNNLLIEPISLEFLNEYKLSYKKIEKEKRKNQILYNPKKGYKITQKIMQQNDEDYEFIPLTGYNVTELISLYKSSKLYIDFGLFPGAERMPKEAVLFGCNIITGKHGASQYFNDVPIPSRWKFDDNQEIEISKAIKKLINNYEKYNDNFEIYKKRVINLENEFINKLKLYFFTNE